MRIQVGDVRLFFDVHGHEARGRGAVDARASDGRPAAPRPRLRPRSLQGRDRPLALRRDAGHLPRHARRGPQRPRHARTISGSSGGRTTSGVLRRAPDRAPIVLGLGFGSVVALKYAARHPQHPGALVLALAGRARRTRSGRSRSTSGSVARRGEVARRFYDDMRRAGIRRLPPRLLPAPVALSAHERRDRPRRLEPGGAVEWMRGESKELDLRGRLGAIRAPAIVLAGEDDAWAPLESVQEVDELLRGTGAVPELSARRGTRSSATHPRPTTSCGSSSTTSRRWARREGRRQRRRPLLRRRRRRSSDADGPWMRERPTIVILLPTRPRIDHSLYKEQRRARRSPRTCR